MFICLGSADWMRSKLQHRMKGLTTPGHLHVLSLLMSRNLYALLILDLSLD